jgi:hypothetical protein
MLPAAAAAAAAMSANPGAAGIAAWRLVVGGAGLRTLTALLSCCLPLLAQWLSSSLPDRQLGPDRQLAIAVSRGKI